MTDRVRIIHPNGEISVRDYAFSQHCEMTAVLSKEDRDRYYSKESVTTTADSHFAKAGSNLKWMGDHY